MHNAINIKKSDIPVTASYFAIFDPAEEGGFNVSFPNFPGCVTFGKNFKDAKEKAMEVLELWIEELEAQKQLVSVRAGRPIMDGILYTLSVRQNFV